MFKLLRVIFKDPIDCLFALNSECGPFSAHQAHKAGLRYLNYVVAANRSSRALLFRAINFKCEPSNSVLKVVAEDLSKLTSPGISLHDVFRG